MKQMFSNQSRVIQPSILYFGSAVVLLSTLNEDGSTNLTPMSSAWALGNRIVLGLGEGSHGLANLRRRPETVVNLPDSSLWDKVERLAPLTGATPVPDAKRPRYRHVKDKFAYAGFTDVPSQEVRPLRVGECPLQIEAVVRNMQTAEGFSIVEVEAVCVHAHESILIDDRHVDPVQWNPLIYNFRHYFGLSGQLGKTFKSET
ncbi:flavin reductase family protein [Paenibacillus terreus]|uniref:Flavin reductase family protein n=1 Tax=Paenibacillus terreus TaxID=1387834 RepID=A0ABV5BK05_9BACL